MQVLLDTGPWVAWIDRSEKHHLTCTAWLEDFHGEFFSTEAVLTEVLYLLNHSYKAQAAALDFVLSGVVSIVPSSIDSLKSAKRLMRKYSDLPMDFADASLVVLAEDLGVKNVLTLDRHDFGIYRFARKGVFTIYP